MASVNTQSNPIQIKDISTIGLNENYGSSLNDRLDKIHENFQSIVGSDFLKGADGNSINILAQNTGTNTSNELFQSLFNAVIRFDPNISNEDKNTIQTELKDQTIYLIYSGTGSDKELVSSLPFTFIDPRFKLSPDIQYSGDGENNYINKIDTSCILCYDKTEGGFVSVQSFPTIYWDSNVGKNHGEFCWKINGEKTGLPCRGPEGYVWANGRMYTAVYDRKTQTILAVFSALKDDTGLYQTELIPTKDFETREIQLNTGDSIICVPGFKNGDSISLGSNDQSGSLSSYIITTVYKDLTKSKEEMYIAVIDDKHLDIPLAIENASLIGLLKSIGKQTGLPGLYVPAAWDENGNVTKGHAIWSGDKNEMYIGTLENPSSLTDPNPIENSPVTIYGSLNVNGDGGIDAKTLYLYNSATIEGGVSIEGGATIEGNITSSNSVTIDENLVVNGDIQLGGDNSNISIDGTVKLYGSLNIDGPITGGDCRVELIDKSINIYTPNDVNSTVPTLYIHESITQEDGVKQITPVIVTKSKLLLPILDIPMDGTDFLYYDVNNFLYNQEWRNKIFQSYIKFYNDIISYDGPDRNQDSEFLDYRVGTHIIENYNAWDQKNDIYTLNLSFVNAMMKSLEVQSLTYKIHNVSTVPSCIQIIFNNNPEKEITLEDQHMLTLHISYINGDNSGNQYRIHTFKTPINERLIFEK